MEESRVWGWGGCGRGGQTPAHPGRAVRGRDSHPHLHSLLSFVPSWSRVSQETLKWNKEEMGTRMSPRSSNVATVPQGTQSGWDRRMGSLKVVLNGAKPGCWCPARCHLPAAPTAVTQGWHRALHKPQGTKCGPGRVSDNPHGTAASKRGNQVSNLARMSRSWKSPKISWAALKTLALRRLSDGKTKG